MKPFLKSPFRTLWPLAVVFLAIVYVSCYPDHELSASDYDSVSTFYNKSVKFDTVRTYFMPDSVFHLTQSGVTDNLTRAYDAVMLSTVASNLTAQGYTRTTDTTLARSIVLVAATTSTYYVYYPGYGGCWWYWYYCGWYYPPYYGGGYTYSTGTILIQMFDGNGPRTPASRKMNYWVAALNGLLDRSSPSSVIQGLINQAFSQSPYL